MYMSYVPYVHLYVYTVPVYIYLYRYTVYIHTWYMYVMITPFFANKEQKAGPEKNKKKEVQTRSNRAMKSMWRLVWIQKRY